MESTAKNAIVARLRGVTHRYGATVALDHVDLSMPAGCVAGLIGPDGVGKSTLLGLIAGARKIQTGLVEVFGADARQRRVRAEMAQRIAYMPQGLGGNLYATLSVVENVDFFGRVFGLNAAQRQWRIDELLESTELTSFRDRPAGKLSGGMKQKLGLCCALIHDPELLILDEPTAGIDPLSRRQFWQLIKRMRGRSPALSLIVATANMDEAEGFDWLVVLDSGKVLSTGAPADIRARTGSERLEEAFIELLPEAKRRGYRKLDIPPRDGSSNEIAIEARGLTMRFGDFTAVDRATFRIERGEIFGFLGSNGCGKTTTMKMLTGLLAPSAGEARLFGHRVDAHDLNTRKRVGYMSQSFSLYRELTVRQNLDLHARLFHVPPDEIPRRVGELMTEFELDAHADHLPDTLPLGMRQRLSLAVAIAHRPELLILDEPTSGVDPIARDEFWRLLVELSRRDGVTIFISTHFMNEGERCDRVSLMHAGEVLASDAPKRLVSARAAVNLEQAFIGYLEEASSRPAKSPARPSRAEEREQASSLAPLNLTVDETKALQGGAPARAACEFLSARRLFAYARREALELMRDPVRLAFAFCGPLILMLVFGYGISFDVENVAYAVLDYDRTPASRHYVEQFRSSRYFAERPAVSDPAAADRRLRRGEVTLVIEIPHRFGADIERGRPTTVAVWIDGAMPFRAETARGYVNGVHQHYLAELQGGARRRPLVQVETRFRYNQEFKSTYAMIPGIIMVLLMMVPAMMTAVSVVREKELGSINNLYATPVTRGEFLLGKQSVYVAVALASFVSLTLVAIFVFAVPVRGSWAALALGALLFTGASTGFGLLISSFVRTQIAAIFAAAILSVMPSVNFSGFFAPVAALSGVARIVGEGFPSSHFQAISVGAFTKALGFADLMSRFGTLALFVIVFFCLSLWLLKAQEN